MKSLIFKKFSSCGKFERMEIFFAGIRIYAEEWESEKLKLRNIGFKQFSGVPGEIEDEDYYPEE